MSRIEEIKGTEKDDILEARGEDGFWEITGRDDRDIITGGNGINIIYGDAQFPLGAKEILSEKEYKKIEELYTRPDIRGTEAGGDDTITGGSGVNIIHAGLGDDEITGGAGVNLIQFKAGDGDDTIINGKGKDYLYFCDCKSDDVSFAKNGNDLKITYKTAEELGGEVKTGSVTLKDYFLYKENFSVKGIGFNSAFDTGYKADVEPTASILMYDDNITVEKLADSIKKAFINSAEISDFYSDVKHEIVMENPGKVTANKNGSSIKGSDGNDIIYGGAGDDIIQGNAGNDKLYGGRSKNTFIFSDGDGKDTVYYQNGEDIIDISKADFKGAGTEFVLLKDRNDLIIKYGEGAQSGQGGDEIRLVNYLRSNGKSNIKLKFVENGEKVVKNIKDFAFINMDFSNETRGKSISGTFLNDNIKGTGKNDVIGGGNGNDTIKGGEGNDTVRGGNGDDIIFGEGGNDRLYGDNGNDTIYGGDGNDIIYGGNGDDVIYGGTGNDKLYGEAGFNTFRFKEGDGNDIIYSGRGTDTLCFDDANFSDLTWSLSKSNGLVANYGNGDSVEIAGYFSKKGKVSTKKTVTKDGEKTLDEIVNDKDFKVLINGVSNKRNTLRGTYKNDILTGGDLNDTILGNDGDDILFGGGGNDLLRGGNGNDTIEGGKGNDRLYGDSGKNIFLFNKGDGQDTVYSGKGQDTIKFADINEFDPKTMYFRAKGNNLIINYGAGDSITVVGYLANPAKSSVQHIQFMENDAVLISDLIKAHPFEFYGVSNKRNSIRGTNEKDIITGGTLNDTITARGGDDIIYAGDGADLVRGGNGDDLIFGEGGNDRLYGDNGNDTIYGGGGNDTIYGGNGDDIIFGGTGNDRLYGDTGSNTFYFKEGDGNDTIYMNSKASDTLVFDKSLEGTLTFDRTGNNLVVKYGTKGDSVTILNYLNNKNPSVKNIVFADYDSPRGDFSKDEGILLSNIVVKKQAVKFRLENGKTVNGEYYKGNEYNNLIISTGAYSEIDAGAGDDVMYLQSRNVEAYGGKGDDKYIVSSLGNNTYIEDTEGCDTIKILDKKQNVKVLFDVKISGDGTVEAADPDYDSVLIVNNGTFNRIKSTGKFNVTSGVEISDFSNRISDSNEGQSGGVCRIETNNGYLDIAQLNSIKGAVASWLAGSNGKYESAMDVLAGGNKADIKELLAVYQTVENKWI